MGGALASTFGAAATSVSKKVLSLPGSYVTALLATIPVSWLLSELLPSPSAQFGKSERTDKEKLGVLLRAVAAGGIGSFILVLPTGLDKNKQSTMVASVFCGFFLLTTVKSLMFPDVNPDVPMHQNLSGRSLLTSFANYATPFAKIFFPVFEVEPKLRLPTDEQVQRSLYCLAVALAKLLALPLLSTQAFRLADLPSPSLAQRHVFPPLIWAAKVLAGTWQFDLLEAFVPLFTFGRYQSAPFNNNLLASTSISEFWAYRYNRMVSLFLRRTVHDPLRHRSVAGPLAATLTFAASGLLHSYVAHYTFGKGQVSSLLYFLTHAAAVHFEHRHLSQVGKPVVNVAFLLAVLVATFPLYPQLFLSAGKTWLDSETLAPAWTYKVMSRVVPSLVDI